MIIELIQKPTSIELSYINHDGGIAFDEYKIHDQPYRYPIWTVCDQVNPHFQNIKDISGKPVELKYAKRFNRFDLIQYLEKLSDGRKEELFAFREPRMAAFDIETLIGEEFEDPENAGQPIISISNTIDNEHLDTVVLTTADVSPDLIDKANDILQEYLEPLKLENPVRLHIVQASNEKQMMTTWLSKFVKPQIAITGWNIDGYDMPYFRNRAKKLGVDMRLGSIKNTIDWKGNPTHTIFEDMMFLCKDYEYSLGVCDSYSLDYIANKILNIGKLKYDHDLKWLWENDKPRFLAYNAIDTILPILIHREKKTINAIYMLAATAKLPYKETKGPVAQAESICMHYINSNFKGSVVVAEGGEFDATGSYEGGWVKPPVRHFARSVACFDVSSEYPSAKRTYNISPENFVKRVKNREEYLEYEANPAFIVTVTGSVYKNDKDYMYRTVQTTLYTRRKMFQRAQFDYMLIADKISHELKDRKLISSV